MAKKRSVAGLLIRCLGLLYFPTSPTVNMFCGQISLEILKIWKFTVQKKYLKTLENAAVKKCLTFV